jgi:hypothetical protein
MEYKSPYLTSNVRPNLIMIALHDLFNTMYIKILIFQSIQDGFDMFTLFRQTHFINISCETNDVSCDNNNENGFEEEQEDISIDTMVQNILSSEQIYDYLKML